MFWFRSLLLILPTPKLDVPMLNLGELASPIGVSMLFCIIVTILWQYGTNCIEHIEMRKCSTCSGNSQESSQELVDQTYLFLFPCCSLLQQSARALPDLKYPGARPRDPTPPTLNPSLLSRGFAVPLF